MLCKDTCPEIVRKGLLLLSFAMKDYRDFGKWEEIDEYPSDESVLAYLT